MLPKSNCLHQQSKLQTIQSNFKKLFNAKMNLDDVLNSLHISEQFGHVVSLEEGIILHNSLLILQNENHFRKVYFWGRIFGIDSDYFVAYGYRKDALSDRIYYYSTNCTNWGLLPTPTEVGKKLTPLCSIKFQGDPALFLDVLIEKDETSLGPLMLKEPAVRKLKEEDRLSTTIHLITHEAALVPRGSLFRRPDGITVENLCFEGLTTLEARELNNFLHYRMPTQRWNTNLLTRDDFNYAMDFLDPLDLDLPEGCWIVSLAGGETLVTLKSIYWPGMLFYHYLKTPKYGFVYFGNGIRCMDVPFLISCIYPALPPPDPFAGK